jgi:rfaE bifunctional protein nucleotidyltransferase chain/domain
MLAVERLEIGDRNQTVLVFPEQDAANFGAAAGKREERVQHRQPDIVQHPRGIFDAEGTLRRIPLSHCGLGAVIHPYLLIVGDWKAWRGWLATLETVNSLYSRGDLLEQRARWRAEGKRVVFTNGCFDLLHPGHIRTLEAARSLGDVLILGLNSDAGVRRMKGPSRPILDERERAEVAGELEAVDGVVLFDEETPRELIAELLPDVLVKGADWSHFIAGREEVEAAGGRVIAIDLQPGYSTTNLVDSLISQP